MQPKKIHPSITVNHLMAIIYLIIFLKTDEEYNLEFQHALRNDNILLVIKITETFKILADLSISCTHSC